MTNDLPDITNYDSIPIEKLKALVERREQMQKRNEILSHYNIHQLPNGAWYTRLNGKKRQFKKREDLENAIISFEENNSQNIKSIFPEYLERRKEQVAKTTWAFDLNYYNTYIKPAPLSDIPIKEIKLSDGYDFFKFCKDIKPDMKRKYWNNIKGTVNTIFQYVIDEGIINDNPFRNLKIAKDKLDNTKRTEEDTVFSQEEKEAVCEYARLWTQQTKRAEPLGILILFNLGLRVGELCALKWKDLETLDNNKYLHIQREILSDVDLEGKVRGIYVADHTKTPAGDRLLPLLPETLEIFDKIIYYNKQNHIPVEKEDYIFLRWYQGKLSCCTKRCFDKRLRTFCERVGMSEAKSCHDIRRTTLTGLYHAKMPLKNIQYFAGHSTLRQTMDYLKLQTINKEGIENIQYLSEITMTLLNEQS